MKISVCIPCYEMHGRGLEMLSFSFTRLLNQTFSDFEVVVSDDSENDEIKELCSIWKQRLDIRYLKNDGIKGLSSNLNNAILNSSGDIIKVLCQDDFLYDNNSLKKTYDAFDKDCKWLVSSYYHTKDRQILYKCQNPEWNPNICFSNTIGTHSCLSLVNEPISPLFDVKLVWRMDCEFYYQLFLAYGLPKVLRDPTVVQYIWEGQTTNTVSTQQDMAEIHYILTKYEEHK